MSTPKKTNHESISETHTKVKDGTTSPRRKVTRRVTQISEPEIIDINILSKPESSSLHQHIANLIALVAVIVSIILAYYTFRLYQKASTQTKAALDAVKFADSSYHSNKDYNEKTLKKQQIALDRAQIDADNRDVQDKINSDRQERAINAQIASLNEAQKEFEVENRPFLNVADIKIDSFEIDKRVFVNWTVKNSGKLPAKIITEKYGFIISPNSNYRELNAPMQSGEMDEGSYLTNSQIFPLHLRADIITPQIYDDFKHQKLFMYLYGIYTYKNVNNEKLYSYNFSFRISLYPIYNVKTMTD